MLKLISSAANKQGKRKLKDMTFLRRLLCQGRALLSEYQLFGYQRYNGLPDWRFLKIEFPPRGKPLAGGNVGRSSAGRGATPSLSLPELSNSSITGRISNVGRSRSPGSAFKWFGEEVRRIFINNILSRVTTNEQIARKTAQRLLYGDSRPFFALVGVSMAAGASGMFQQESEFDSLCWEIRDSMAKQEKNKIKLLDAEVVTQEGTISVKDLVFGKLIKQGCSAAVYSAEWAQPLQSEANSNESSQPAAGTSQPLAVKMLFNYEIESVASSILRGMVREIVPAKHISLDKIYQLDRGIFGSVRRCSPHDNIIEISHAFVDQIPVLPGGIENYPSALPPRLNPRDGLGRNMSLFLVMRRYDCNLSEFLTTRSELTFRQRMLILTQILEGVAHLERNKIAHRDLKTDNILLDLSGGDDSPRVVLTDFGCCLADKSNGLQLPFHSYDTERGGNAALMAPEVSTAEPGAWKWISYEKSDAWTVGAIAYEVFGEPNPFYKTLDSRTYKDSDLPEMEVDVSPKIKCLVKELLRRNLNERLNAQMASVICHLHLWGPSSWLSRKSPEESEVMQWLVTLTTKVLCNGSDELQYRMIQNFLRRVTFREVRDGIAWLQKVA